MRSENDSLGVVEIPVGALYGAQTQRAVENFPISGLKPWKAFIWSMAAIKYTAAQVNEELGLLEPRLAEVIRQAAQEVMQDLWNDQFVVDPFQAGAGTSHHMNVNEVIANRATQLLGGELGQYLVHPNDHVNMAQSTNDVIPTAIRLGCLWRLDELLEAIQQLAHTLGQKAIEFDEVLKSGRTHLQDAVPIRLGQEFGAYGLAIERDRKRIMQAAVGLRRIGIGGTAVGTGLNAHPEYHDRMVVSLSTLTGIELMGSDNLFESMQSMADVVGFSSALRTLAVTLTRIANDLRLLSSGPATGLNEIAMPAVQPGSSIMPGKVNPVMAEMLNMAMYHVMGNDQAVMLAAQAGQLELNVMMPVIAHNIFEMMQVLIGSIRAFTDKAVRGLEANQEAANLWLERNAIIITALNPLIGYEAGAALVKQAQVEGRMVREIAVEQAEAGMLLHKDDRTALTSSQVEQALANIRKLTDGGIVSS